MHLNSVSMFQKLKNILYVYVNSLFYETFIETFFGSKCENRIV